MPILHMDTHDVSALADQLQRASNEIMQITHELRRSAHRLDANWHGSSSSRYQQQMAAALRAVEAVADDASWLGRRVYAEVEDWIEADQSGAGRVLGAIAPIPMPVPTPMRSFSSEPFEVISGGEQLGALLEGIDTTWKAVEILLALSATPFVSLSAGQTYTDQVIIHGPQWAKKLLGLSPALTHAKGATVVTHFSKLAGQLNVLDLIGPTILVGQQWLVDIDKYRDDSVRLGTAMALDMFIISAISLSGTVVGGKTGAIAGSKVGAVIGSLLAPGPGTALGAAAGAIIGGVAGKIGGSWLAEQGLERLYLESEWRERLINATVDNEYKLLELLNKEAEKLAFPEQSLAPAFNP